MEMGKLIAQTLGPVVFGLSSRAEGKVRGMRREEWIGKDTKTDIDTSMFFLFFHETLQLLETKAYHKDF